MPADAAGPSEKADKADLLNSESEHSEEEEFNPDDFSEDVSHNICCNVFFRFYGAIQAHQQAASFSQVAILVLLHCQNVQNRVFHVMQESLSSMDVLITLHRLKRTLTTLQHIPHPPAGISGAVSQAQDSICS